jgi:hypothetical protein
MGYRVKELPNKKSQPKWKIQYISYKKKDIQNTNQLNPRKTWDISKDRWKPLGFYKYMNAAEAKVRAKQLSAQAEIKAQEERIRKSLEEEDKFKKRFDSILPEEFEAEFEKRFVTRTYLSADREYGRNRALARWRAARKVIITINTEPSDWYYNLYDFYDYFSDRQLSIRYMNEVMKFVNLWGFFICKKMGRPFLPVSRPGGYERRRIITAYFEKKTNRSKASKEITPIQLVSSKANLREDLYNWIYLTVWLGLRPKEVDNLHDENLWKVEELFNGRKVLWIYQTKVIALPEEDRWKPIPILYPEQEVALEILDTDTFKRPLVKTVRNHFGKDRSLYGGRKGFTDLMLSKGNTLENISVWMGHSTINRTWKSYKNRQRYHIQYGT